MEQENTTQGQEQQVEQQEQQQEQQEQQVQQEAPQERNFRELREQNERLRKEQKELKRKAEELEAYKKQFEQKQQASQNQDIGEDDLVEGRHLKKYKQELEQYKQDIESRIQQQSARVQLRQDFSDFDSVMTADNIQELEKKDPDLAYSISNTHDPYLQGKLAYKYIKKLNIVDDETQKEKDKVHQNAQAPRPSQDVQQKNDGPLNYAYQYSQSPEEKRQQIRKQLMENAKRNRP